MFSLLTVAVFLWYLDRTSKQLHILTHSEVLDRDVLWMIRFLCHKHAKLWFGGWREQLWEISQGPGQVGHHVSSNARQCTIMKEDDSTASVAYLTLTWHHQGGTRSPAEVGSTQGRKAVRRHPWSREVSWLENDVTILSINHNQAPPLRIVRQELTLNCIKLLCPWPVATSAFSHLSPPPLRCMFWALNLFKHGYPCSNFALLLV